MSRMRSLLALATLTLLSACGGGGGGGGGGGARLTLDNSSFDLGTAANGAGPQVELRGRISGQVSQLYLYIEHTNLGIQSVSQPTINGDTGTATISMRAGSSLAQGVYRDTVQVRACTDSACNQQLAGSPATVTVSYTVGIPATPAELAVTAVEGSSTPISRSLEFSFRNRNAAWTAQPDYGDSTSTGWLSATPAAGTGLPATTSVRLQAQPAGNYSANLTIRINGESRSIPVQYQVQSLLDASFAQPLRITNANAGTTITTQTVVRSRDSSRAVAWTASLSEAPSWLSLDPASGNTGAGNPVGVRIDPASLAEVPNGHYEAVIRISSSAAGVSAILVPLPIELDRSFVRSVAPAAEAAAKAGEILISGDRLLDLGTIQEVRFGDTLATSVVADNSHGTGQLRVGYPSMPAGEYPVRVRAGDRQLHGKVALSLVGDANYAGAGSTKPVVPNGTQWLPELFDPAARSLYAVPQFATGPIFALRRADSGWTLQQSTAEFPSLVGAALSQQGRVIVAVSENRDIIEIDAASLQRLSTTPIQLANQDLYANGTRAAHDGSVIIPIGGQLLKYRTGRHDYSTVTASRQMPLLYSSTAGNAMLGLVPISTDSPVTRIDPRDLGSLPFLERTDLSVTHVLGDRFGDRWALVGEPSHSDAYVAVYNGSGTLLGAVDAGTDFYQSYALNADGTRLYLSFRSRNGGTAPSSNPQLEVYDLSATPAQGQFPLLRAIPIGLANLGILGLTPDESELLTIYDGTISALRLQPQPQPAP